MKKTPKQIAAIVALVAIILLIIAFIISAATTTADSKEGFYSLFFSVIAIPILAWLILFSYGRFRGKHTMAEFFPEGMAPNAKDLVPPNPEKSPEDPDFTEAQVNEAFESNNSNESSDNI